MNALEIQGLVYSLQYKIYANHLCLN